MFMRVQISNSASRYVLNGIVAHYKATTPGRSSGMWGEAVRLLEGEIICTSL